MREMASSAGSAVLRAIAEFHPGARVPTRVRARLPRPYRKGKKENEAGRL